MGFFKKQEHKVLLQTEMRVHKDGRFVLVLPGGEQKIFVVLEDAVGPCEVRVRELYWYENGRTIFEFILCTLMAFFLVIGAIGKIKEGETGWAAWFYLCAILWGYNAYNVIRFR